MLPIKLQIDDSFFQSEERNGYIVSEKMKRVWAVELDLLNEFTTVCYANNLKWFAHAGTLLGAVRHNGFIPWDDDIDVMMPRADYDRLCAIGPKQFQSPYFFQTEATDVYFCRNFARLRNSLTTAIQKREEQFCFPYNQGIFIDIFPYDHLPDDDNELRNYMINLLKIENQGQLFRNLVHFYKPKKGKGFIKRNNFYIKHLWFKYVKKKDGDYKKFLRTHLDLITSYNCIETNRVGEMVIPPLGRHIWDKEWLDHELFIPFEMLQVAVPCHYEDCLAVSFGNDWHTPKPVNNYHGQIFFDTEHPYTDYLKHK